jgi:AbrB family looped-hinge helix DNA binding protein
MRFEVAMGSRGQVTIPKKMRSGLGLRAGCKITFTQLRDGTIVMRTKRFKLSEIASILTMASQPSISIEEMRR